MIHARYRERLSLGAMAAASGALALSATIFLSGCAIDNGPVGCRGLDVQTATGSSFVGITFDYKLPDGTTFESATVEFGDGISTVARSDIIVMYDYPERDAAIDYQLQATIQASSGEAFECPSEPVTIAAAG